MSKPYTGINGAIDVGQSATIQFSAMQLSSAEGFGRMDDDSRETVVAAHKVADKLVQHGHIGHAGALRAALADTHPRSLFLSTLREACQVVLTAIEAIDPVCATFVEELRLEVDKRLMAEHSSAAGG
jgi:hypothetical protein